MTQPQLDEHQLNTILSALQQNAAISPQELSKLLKKYPKANGAQYSKSEVFLAAKKNQYRLSPTILKTLVKKPIRTASGVTPVTVLTKPYPCPGECIFCPSDIRMPKSYIANEPGAQRAGQNGFDPYLQTYNRLQAFKEIGHPTEKVELIVLGGTWSVYPETYQIWFIKRLFDALNDFGSNRDARPQQTAIDLNKKITSGQTYNTYIATKTNYLNQPDQTATWTELKQAHQANQSATSRCVGLVLETRPDYVSQNEVIRLRRLGATKIQIGIQSLSDQVLTLNKRGHTVAQTKQALNLLRQAGFKLHCHYMPNLYGSSTENDCKEYDQLFTDANLMPDELKVYPCSLIDDTELMHIYKQGKWKPYTDQELQTVLTYMLTHTPEYCRLTRVVRDIPGTEIVAGNKKTNLRQLVEAKIDKRQLHDIRAREIKHQIIDINDLTLDTITYKTQNSTEYFLQFITANRSIAGFLRLSLPATPPFIDELHHAAIIREVHVYGQALNLGQSTKKNAQHQGLGKRLIAKAIKIAKENNYRQISVISAIGTEHYYESQGFSKGNLYHHRLLE